jgi:hypothetical protein
MSPSLNRTRLVDIGARLPTPPMFAPEDRHLIIISGLDATSIISKSVAEDRLVPIEGRILCSLHSFATILGGNISS